MFVVGTGSKRARQERCLMDFGSHVRMMVVRFGRKNYPDEAATSDELAHNVNSLSNMGRTVGVCTTTSSTKAKLLFIFFSFLSCVLSVC